MLRERSVCDGVAKRKIEFRSSEIRKASPNTLLGNSFTMSAATATATAALAPFYGSESVHANAIQPLAPLSTKQTIYVAGVPHLITEDISDRAWTYAQVTLTGSQGVHKNDGDLILVHQNTIEFNGVKYTVDYITTLNNGVWYQYKVIYNSEFADTPLPHTIDFRFQTNQALAVPPTHIRSSSSAFSSSAFRAAAYKSF